VDVRRRSAGDSTAPHQGHCPSSHGVQATDAYGQGVVPIWQAARIEARGYSGPPCDEAQILGYPIRTQCQVWLVGAPRLLRAPQLDSGVILPCVTTRTQLCVNRHRLTRLLTASRPAAPLPRSRRRCAPTRRAVGQGEAGGTRRVGSITRNFAELGLLDVLRRSCASRLEAERCPWRAPWRSGAEANKPAGWGRPPPRGWLTGVVYMRVVVLAYSRRP